MQQNLNKLKIKINLKIKKELKFRELIKTILKIYEFQSINEAIEFLNLHKNISKYYYHINKCLKENTTAKKDLNVSEQVLQGNTRVYRGFIWKYSISQILPDEIWENIPQEIIEYENCQISTKGRIQTPNGTITYGNKNRQGYMTITINNNVFKVHRLVALVLIYNDDPENKTIVNHINEHKDDNNVENLEWCTPSENIQHSQTSKKVKCEYNNEILTFDNCTEVVKWIQNNIQENASENFIRKSCQSESKKAYGIKFWYSEAYGFAHGVE